MKIAALGDIHSNHFALETCFEYIYKMLLYFDEFFDKMNGEDKRTVLTSLIEEVHLHPKET